MNFLSNASKYTDKGEIKIVASLFNDNIIKIEVIDSGCGID